MARDRAAARRRRRRTGSSWRPACPSTRSSSPTSTAGPTARVAREIRQHTDADGLAREDRWAAGAPGPDAVAAHGQRARALAGRGRGRSRAGRQATSSTRTTSPRSSRRAAPTSARLLAAADELRREVCGDEVSYVVTRNVNYTNVCYFRCGFCAFSKGKLAANLRGKPYLVPVEEIVRRAREAWERGAVEICLQGGIHPAFTGETYLEICAAVKEALPDLHVHAFSALEVWQGAATLGLPARGLPRPPARRRPRLAPRHRGGDPRRRGAARALPGQGEHRAVARGARRRAPRRAALDDDGHVRRRRGPAQLGAPPARAARPAAARRAASPSSCRSRSCTWRRRSTSRATRGRARRSARPCSCTRSAGSRCTRGSRTCRPRG